MEFAESVVVIADPEDGLTVNGSHPLVAPWLFASPLYTAFQLNEPALLNVCEAELGTIPPVTDAGAPTAVPVPLHVEPAKRL